MCSGILFVGVVAGLLGGDLARAPVDCAVLGGGALWALSNFAPRCPDLRRIYPAKNRDDWFFCLCFRLLLCVKSQGGGSAKATPRPFSGKEPLAKQAFSEKRG